MPVDVPTKNSASRDPISNRLREQVKEFIACEPDVRVSRADAVHRMRVATRRIRSCLRTFHAAFAKDSARHLNIELKWIGGHLGAERDAEVIHKRIVGELSELHEEQIVGPVKTTLSEQARSEMDAAHKGLVEAMNSPRFQSLLKELAAFADDPPYSSKRDIRWLSRQLAKTAHRNQRLITKAESLSGPEREAALHEVRKAAKHVRYAAETLEPVFGKRTRRVQRNFEELQEILGEHHDATVIRHFYREQGVRAESRPGENGFTYGLLYAREEARARACESAFKEAWKRARRSLLSMVS